MNSVTRRQFDMLVAIDAFIKCHGYAPTHRELGNVLSIRSTNGVNDHLHALARKGLIELGGFHQFRALKITAAGRALLPPPARANAPPFAAELAIEVLDLSA